MVKNKQVEEIIIKYKQILNLRDWQICFEIVSRKILQKILKEPNDKKTSIHALMITREEEHTAFLYICKYADQNEQNLSLEAIIVHELIHIIMDPIKESFELIFKLLFEKKKNLKKNLLKNILELLVTNNTDKIVNYLARIIIESNGDLYLQKTDRALKAKNQKINNKNIEGR